MSTETTTTAATIATRRTHENTVTSKTNREIESTLESNLVKIVNAVLKEINKSDVENRVGAIDITVRPLMNSFVYATFRKHITESYMLGINYVTSISRLDKIPGYLTNSDIDKIKLLADSYLERFWGRISDSLKREEENEDYDLTVHNITDPLAIGATNEALNIATITKAKKFTGNFTIGDLGSKEGASTEEFSNDFLAEGFPLELPLGIEFKMEWVTAQDNRVCPICEELSGDYSLDEFIPQPVEDSHPNCRCRLLFIENEEVL